MHGGCNLIIDDSCPLFLLQYDSWSLEGNQAISGQAVSC